MDEKVFQEYCRVNNIHGNEKRKARKMVKLYINAYQAVICCELYFGKNAMIGLFDVDDKVCDKLQRSLWLIVDNERRGYGKIKQLTLDENYKIAHRFFESWGKENL